MHAGEHSNNGLFSNAIHTVVFWTTHMYGQQNGALVPMSFFIAIIQTHAELIAWSQQGAEWKI